MATESSGAFAAVTLVTSLPAMFASFILEDRRMRRQPGTRPYTWGLYCGLYSMILSALAAWIAVFAIGGELAAAGPERTGESVALAVFVGIIVGLWGVPGFFMIRRRKWAWIMATILSLNPIWWIVNTIYGRNRWAEFTEEARRREGAAVATGGDDTTPAPPRRRGDTLYLTDGRELRGWVFEVEEGVRVRFLSDGQLWDIPATDVARLDRVSRRDA